MTTVQLATVAFGGSRGVPSSSNLHPAAFDELMPKNAGDRQCRSAAASPPATACASPRPPRATEWFP
jgi:hypothetical protein